MGRRSLQKDRIENLDKKAEWAEKAFPILQERGLKGLNMDQLAQEIGISKATLYKYFRSREELVELIVNQRISAMRDFVLVLNDQSIPYPIRYEKCMSLVAGAMEGVSNTFLGDVKEAYPRIFKMLDDLIEFSLKVLENYYSQGIENGFLEAVNPALLAHTDRFLFQTLTDPDFLQANDLTVKDAFYQYFRIKFLGVLKSDHPSRDSISF